MNGIRGRDDHDSRLLSAGKYFPDRPGLTFCVRVVLHLRSTLPSLWRPACHCLPRIHQLSLLLEQILA